MATSSKAKSSKAQPRTPGRSAQRSRNRFFAFFDTTPGHGLLVVVAVYLVFIFANWARASGSFLDWSITILLIVIAARETAAFVRGVLGSPKAKGHE